MQAAFCLGSGQFELRDVAMPVLNSGEVLLRVEAAGICGSDKWELSQPKVRSRVAGHEISGVIEAVNGDAGPYSPGMAVVLEPAVGCGQCDACRGGNFTACRRASVIGYGRPGGFAEYLAVPQQNLFPMPPSLSFAEASLAEPTAVAVHAVGLASVAGQTCVVFGSSTIGLLVAQVLRERGAEAIWVVDIRADQLQIASELNGIQTVNSAQDPELHALSTVSADVCFEAVGHVDAVLDAATKILRRNGTLILLGSGHPGGLSTNAIVSKSFTVRGSSGRTVAEFRQGLDLLATHRIRVEPLITTRHSLIEMEKAFEQSRSSMKVVVEPGRPIGRG